MQLDKKTNEKGQLNALKMGHLPQLHLQYDLPPCHSIFSRFVIHHYVHFRLYHLFHFHAAE